MPAPARACPKCSSRLQPLSDPARMRCTGCGRIFTRPGASAPPAPPAAEPTTTSTRTVLLIAAGSGALLLLVMGGFLALVLSGERRDAEEAQATAKGPASTERASAEPRADATEPPPPPPAADEEKPPEPPRLETSLSKEEHEIISEAIDLGVEFLKQQVVAQNYRFGHPGVGPFIGLTLLECGVAPEDDVVQQLVQFTRDRASGLTNTYALSTSILFLDRLGRAEDKPHIRTMALRLIANQNAAGGWSYPCPALDDSEEEQLLRYLDSHETRLAAGGGVRRLRPGEGEDASGPGAGGVGRSAPIPRDDLPPSLRQRPVVQHDPGEDVVQFGPDDDNSNTQFATLALWVARRHGVPVERCLSMIASRFLLTQNDDGSWGYKRNGNQWPHSMTCAGLLGLAVARAVPGKPGGAADAREKATTRGLEYLGGTIGLPGGVRQGFGNPQGRFIHSNSGGDLYYLWSVERVGVLYHLSTLGGKDWYAWGAGQLVAQQRRDGSWHETHAPLPSTCFALLFLKRANVAKDLTMQLQRLGPVRDPGANRTKD